MIRKLPSGKYRLYSRKVIRRPAAAAISARSTSRAAAEKQERAVQYFKRH